MKSITPQSKLKEEITKLSNANDWGQVKKEWFFDHAYISERPRECPCGKENIWEICVIRNVKNNNIAEVGNVCVRKFMEIDARKFINSIKRVAQHGDRALGWDVIKHAYEMKWIDEWQFEFYRDTHRKPRTSMSENQIGKRMEINRKILKKLQCK
ncbi:MAG: hypothetical protein AB7U75_18760 [Hyphomicrobiaceae bacterium]